MCSHIFSDYQCYYSSREQETILIIPGGFFLKPKRTKLGIWQLSSAACSDAVYKTKTHSYEERADRKLPPETIFGNSFLLNRHNTEVTHCCGSFHDDCYCSEEGKESEADIFPFDTQECQTFLSHQNLSVTFWVAFPWRAQRQERQWRDSSRLFTGASRSAISPFFSISSPNFISTLPRPPASPWLPDKVSNTWAAPRYYLPCVLAWWRCSLSCGFPASSTVKSIPTTWRIES